MGGPRDRLHSWRDGHGRRHGNGLARPEGARHGSAGTGTGGKREKGPVEMEMEAHAERDETGWDGMSRFMD